MAFETSTRLKLVPIGTLTKPTGGGSTSIELPKTGILAGIFLPISITASGTLSAPYAYGACGAVKRVSLRINSGHNLIDISGVGYHYLLREMLNGNGNNGGYTTGRTAVTATTFNLDMFLPVAYNMRDHAGLIMLQNETTLLTLTIEWEADATVATGATVTGTAKPMLALFEVPSNPKEWPDFSVIHQVIEEQQTISGAGDLDHQIQRGATLVGQYYFTGATTYTNAELRVQQSNIIYKTDPEQHRTWFNLMKDGAVDLNMAGSAVTGYNNRLFWDFGGSDGLGQFGTTRDVLDTNSLTSIFTRLTLAGASTLFSVRRQLVPLG